MSMKPTTSPAFASEVRKLLADSLRVHSQRWLIIITLALGVAVTVALTVLLPPDLREFALYSLTTQLVMSVTLPFLGVVMVHAATRRPGPSRPAPAMAAALLIAVAVAAFGVVINALAFVLAAHPTLRLYDPVVALTAPFLAQLLAQSVGTGLGLLIRQPVVASLATIVLPLSAYLLLGLADAVTVRQWLTPLGSTEVMLPGGARPLDWAAWAVVALLWGAALNAAGLLRLKAAAGPRSRSAP